MKVTSSRPREKIKRTRRKVTAKYTPKPMRKGQNEVYQDRKEENRRNNVRGKRLYERRLRKKQTGWLKKWLNTISKGHSWRKRNGLCRKGLNASVRYWRWWRKWQRIRKRLKDHQWLKFQPLQRNSGKSNWV